MNDVSCDWSMIAVREQLLLKAASVLFALASLVLIAVAVIFSVNAFVGSKFGAAVALVAVLVAVNTGIAIAAAIAEPPAPPSSTAPISAGAPRCGSTASVPGLPARD